MVRTARVGAADQDGAGDRGRRAEGDALRRADACGERLCQPCGARQLLDPPRIDREDHRPAEHDRQQRREAGRGARNTDFGGRGL